MNPEHTRQGFCSKIRFKFIICFFLVIVTTAAYWQVRHHEFTIFDDDGYVSENLYVRSGLNRRSVRWAFSFNDIAYWHPITWISHMLDVELYGLNPGMHHRTNLLLHIANSLALFVFFNWTTGFPWRSACVAALFALHPINVESVAWIAERKNVLSTFFWMLTLLAYVKYSKNKHFGWYAVALSVFALGLMAKPMLVTLPFVLLLMDYWPLNRFRAGVSTPFFSDQNDSLIIRVVLEKIPFVLLSAASIILSFLSLGRQGVLLSTETIPLVFRIANALVSYVKYIGKLFWPMELSVFYHYPSRIPWVQAFVAMLVLLGLSWFLIRVLRRIPGFGTGWLWFLGTFLPVMGLLQAGLWPAMADRWAYVPFIGLFVIIVWAMHELLKDWRFKAMAAALMAGAVLSIFTVKTWMQVEYWHNSVSLFTHAVHIQKKSQLAHYNLGVALEMEGRPAEAMTHYRAALNINPNYSKARNNLGLLLASEGKTEEAIDQYSETVRRDPDFADAYNNLGILFLELGKTGEAIRYFSEALRRNPAHTATRNNMGIAMVRMGMIKEAITHFQAALLENPEDVVVQNNLNILLELSTLSTQQSTAPIGKKE
jgi:tetratricopeptide (TPR) repeat protein